MMTKVVAVGPTEHEKALKELVQEDGVNYKFAACTSLTNDTATLSDGSTLTFDAAVVCTGLKLPIFYPDPETDTTIEARKATIAAFHEKIVNAKSIVVSGGGPVGVETTADIILRFPTKK
jgi:pyruvate/2-oxoglutarate dehydrogenase complex dihydrolipoamide dehydrogenase (E3) component